MAFDLDGLLEFAVHNGVSDVFMKTDTPPTVRLNGIIKQLNHPHLTNDEVEDVAKKILGPDRWQKFVHHPDADTSYSIPNLSRFRVNIYRSRGGCAIVMRVVQLVIRQFQELNLPDVLADFTRYANGLVLVTGPTGSGKSTTLAAMIDLINSEKAGHIVTIEDPIEYQYNDKKCVVSQREVGIDTTSFQAALRASLREAPDTILVGEMRDTETMAICLQAAETGHLVFSTMHTPSAAESMERILSMFQPHEKQLIQQRLAKTLKAIVSQKLIPTIEGKGRMVAVEILNVSPTVAQYIEEGRTGQIYQAIKEGASQWKMQTMNMSLDKLAKAGVISNEQALENSSIRSELRQLLRLTAEAPKPAVPEEAEAVA